MLFLLFQIGEDRFAIEARQAVEVLPLVELQRLPQTARGVAGVLNYRGRAVPALDLSDITQGRPARELLSTRIILVQHADRAGRPRLVGLIGERATALIQRDPREFTASGVPAAPYLGPVLMDDQGLIQLIQPQHLLAGEGREAILEAVAELAHEAD